MTRTSSSSRALTLPSALSGRSLHVTWPGLVAQNGGKARPVAFVVTAQPIDSSRAVLEAWVETFAGRRTVVARQPVACSLVRDDGMLHVDITLAGRCALALTLDEQAVSDRPLFARTDLLDDAGFVPGGYDPPTLRVVEACEDTARTAS